MSRSKHLPVCCHPLSTPRAGWWSTLRVFAFCAFFCLEGLGAAARGGRRGLSFRLDLWPAAVDSLFADGLRHDAAQHPARLAGCGSIEDARPHSMSTLSIGLLYGTATLIAMFVGMPIAFALGAVATIFMMLSCRVPRSIRLRKMSMRRWRRSRSCRFRCSSSRVRRSGSRAPDRTFMARCMRGCIAFPAGSVLQMSSPARCSRRWPGRHRRRALQSARPGFRRCASAAIPAGLRQA